MNNQTNKEKADREGNTRTNRQPRGRANKYSVKETVIRSSIVYHSRS